MRLIAAALALGLLAGCNEPAEAPAVPVQPTVAPVPLELPKRPLRLGRPPHLAVDVAQREFEPLAAYLGKAIDHPIEVVVPKSYNDVVDQLAAGELDLAQLTPLIYVTASERVPGLRRLVSIVGEGAAKYRGYIVAKPGTGVHSPADLIGKRFAFVDRGSASGYLFPWITLVEAGVLPERDFKRVRFAGNHPKVVEWVLNGTVDAGAISSTTFQHLRDQDLNNTLEIIAKTEWIPLDAVVAHPSLPGPVADRLRQTLLQLNIQSDTGRHILQGVATTNGFIPGDDAAYDRVRAALARMRELGAAAPR